MTSPIVVARHDNWAELRIDREDKRNAVNRACRDGLMRAFDGLRGVVKAIVLTGRALNYPDQVACLFASGAIVAALLERDRTGAGAHLDLSQRELTSFLLGEELIAAAAGVPSPRRGNTDPAEPEERLIGEGGGQVEWPAGVAHVRDGSALVSAAEFAHGTAVLCDPNGTRTKGIPFRFTTRPLFVRDGCHELGADNDAVLASAGFTRAQVTALQEAGILATAPRLTLTR
jgi:crotonobetainyl-CoA:carnitine CoA-transferase CaiB-like acyl-CoA transferase